MARPSTAHGASDLAKLSRGPEDDVSTTATQTEHPPNSIRKPTGEAGKPGAGGYKLQIAMGWSKDDYETALVRVRFLIPFRVLTTKFDYSEQSSSWSTII